MSLILPEIADTEPEIAALLEKCFDKYELRGMSALQVQEWIKRALMMESIVGLLRMGMMDVVGVRLSDDGNDVEPSFKNNEALCALVGREMEQPEEGTTVDEFTQLISAGEEELAQDIMKKKMKSVE